MNNYISLSRQSHQPSPPPTPSLPHPHTTTADSIICSFLSERAIIESKGEIRTQRQLIPCQQSYPRYPIINNPVTLSAEKKENYPPKNSSRLLSILPSSIGNPAPSLAKTKTRNLRILCQKYLSSRIHLCTVTYPDFSLAKASSKNRTTYINKVSDPPTAFLRSNNLRAADMTQSLDTCQLRGYMNSKAQSTYFRSHHLYPLVVRPFTTSPMSAAP